MFSEMFSIAVLLIILYLVFGRGEGRGLTMRITSDSNHKYYAGINRACFYVCLLSIAVGFVLTLLMIWEVFDNTRVIEKSWLSLAVFFGTAILVAMVNNMFSLRVVSRDDDKKEVS